MSKSCAAGCQCLANRLLRSEGHIKKTAPPPARNFRRGARRRGRPIIIVVPGFDTPGAGACGTIPRDRGNPASQSPRRALSLRAALSRIRRSREHLPAPSSAFVVPVFVPEVAVARLADNVLRSSSRASRDRDSAHAITLSSTAHAAYIASFILATWALDRLSLAVLAICIAPRAEMIRASAPAPHSRRRASREPSIPALLASRIALSASASFRRGVGLRPRRNQCVSSDAEELGVVAQRIPVANSTVRGVLRADHERRLQRIDRARPAVIPRDCLGRYDKLRPMSWGRRPDIR